MILLKDEYDLNNTTHERWAKALEQILNGAHAVYRERGANLDVTPIHHRLQPEGMLHELQKRCLRIRSRMALTGWWVDPSSLEKVAEECVDIINYGAFLGAFILLLREEAEDEPRDTV